jgi:poly(hydroxyalkanoate) depolymerase family esterase
MTIPLYRRLMRASGLGDSANLQSLKLPEVAARIQHALDKLTKTATPAHDAIDLGKGPSDAINAWGGLKLGGLESLLPGRTKAKAQTASMRACDFVSPAGNRPYKLFVPAKLAAGAPLLVMLHGCTQSAGDFAAGTRMNALAEAEGFVVLYPEQLSSANAQRCWNWFNPNDQQRDQGEAAIIAGMTRKVMAEFKTSPKRVFVAGLSAGGAQAAILGARYPDLYAAIGVHSGLACGAAHDVMSAFSAMQKGRPGQGTLGVPAILFHGDRDTTVNPRNADEVAAQLAAGGATRVEHGTVEGGGLAYTRTIRLATDGKPLLEQWAVHGAGHAWSGGSADGSFTEPRGPDASREMLRFFMSVG